MVYHDSGCGGGAKFDKAFSNLIRRCMKLHPGFVCWCSVVFTICHTLNMNQVKLNWCPLSKCHNNWNQLKRTGWVFWSKNRSNSFAIQQKENSAAFRIECILEMYLVLLPMGQSFKNFKFHNVYILNNFFLWQRVVGFILVWWSSSYTTHNRMIFFAAKQPKGVLVVLRDGGAFASNKK